MRIKKLPLILCVVAVGVISAVVLVKMKQKKSAGEAFREITPFIGAIRVSVSSPGTVLPQNRLEVKPPVNGRVERVLVQEGDLVKTGQTLAWMSSTDRAALVDAARGKGEETLKYWEDTYKPIPLPAPMDAEVIVARTRPGQTVTTADAVVVLSDHLIVRAQVDETDIGRVAPRMKAVITLDAYPDAKISAVVGHVYYESQTVNNVTVYQVDLVPEEVPAFFRSGMNANVDFTVQEKDKALLVPLDAVHTDKDETYVLLKQGDGTEPVKARVTTGISDGQNTEIISGITERDRILLKVRNYSLPKSTAGTNPFMPPRRR